MSDNFLTWSFGLIMDGIIAAVLFVLLIVIGIPVLMIAAHTIIPLLILLFPVWLVRKHGPPLVIGIVRRFQSMISNENRRE